DYRCGCGSGRGTGDHHSDGAQPAFAQRGARGPAQTLMPILEHLWIIPLLPLLGSALNGLLGAKWSKSAINTIALGSTGLSFAGALEAVREFFANGEQTFRKEFFDWIIAG